MVKFENTKLSLKGKKTAEITVFANIPFDEPLLRIGDTEYKGEFVGDNHHARFSMPDLRKSGVYKADIYDGAKLLVSSPKELEQLFEH